MPPDRPRDGDDLGPAGHEPLPGQMGLFFELKADEPKGQLRANSPEAEKPRPRRRRAKGQGGW
jgi:hypothetical protein